MKSRVEAVYIGFRSPFSLFDHENDDFMPILRSRNSRKNVKKVRWAGLEPSTTASQSRHSTVTLKAAKAHEVSAVKPILDEKR